MISLGPEASLRGIVDMPVAEPSSTMLRASGLFEVERGRPPVHKWLRQLHTRLYLYGITTHRESSALPDEVREEIRANELQCLALLLHVNRKLRSWQPAWLVVQEIVERGTDDASEDLVTFLADQIVDLFLAASPADRSVEVVELRRALRFTSEQEAVLSLATLVASYDDRRPQATIVALRKLAEHSHPAGVAALFLLAQVYESLQLPLEELKCLTDWMQGVERRHGLSLGAYAAGLAEENPEMERTVQWAAHRLIELLHASQSRKRVDALVGDFETYGYGRDFTLLRSRRTRVPGVDLRMLSREEAGTPTTVRGRLADVLLRSPLKQACFVLRDDSAADVETFPVPRRGAAEAAILERLPAVVADASVAIHPEVVDEGVLEQRKWIICYDAANPMESLAIGVMAMERESSVVYARAIFFDTELDSGKNDAWFSDAMRVLGRPFDAQKQKVVQEAVRRIIQQASSGHSNIEVEEL
jgi:hypothetical protein